ncbi:ACT domain-containing protein [Seohaeicola saemankumensis]|nr:ACT domain-containing protein [Seohaeicola saemankumensis]MCA0873625.1 ACT domain-containing protein [Seohaeicola saemankumensis]
MPEIARTAQDMIAGMTPQIRAGRFVFVTLPDPAMAVPLLADALAMFREDEGVSLILPAELAQAIGAPTDQPMHCITLNVYSALDGVGLTAAVATALAEQGIACNMVAACHHDHVFVPAADCDRALSILTVLQARAVDRGRGDTPSFD